MNMHNNYQYTYAHRIDCNSLQVQQNGKQLIYWYIPSAIFAQQMHHSDTNVNNNYLYNYKVSESVSSE